MHCFNHIRFERGLLLSETRPVSDGELWKYDASRGLWGTDPINSVHLAQPFDAPSARWLPLFFPNTKLKQLRPDQICAADAWKRIRRGVIVMATGIGKTEVALHLVREVGSHTLFVAPTRALAYQLAARIEAALGTEVGFIGDNTFRLSPISVATYRSAGIKMQFLGDYFKLLVFDECHHLGGDLIGDAARMSAAPYRLGLTATPQRGPDAPCEQLIGPICYESSIAGVRGQLLAKYKIRRIPVYLSDGEQSRYDALGKLIREHFAARRREKRTYGWRDVTCNLAEDPEARHAHLALLARRSIEENAEAKLDVLEDLLREHMQQVVVFVGSNVMARQVSTRFLIPCVLAHSGRKERETILGGFERGEFRAIAANRVLNEGIDIPAAKIGIVIGGTGSEREAIQRLGRILRKKAGHDAVLYEVVCAGTGEEERSRKRRRTDAYK